MPIRVKTPDGGVATFPDDMDPAAISAVLAKRFPKEKEPPPPPPKEQGSYADLIPAAMGAGYSFAGKALGPLPAAGMAFLGGAGGEGYKQLAKHGVQALGAVPEVASHLMNPETRKATYSGLVEGATEGRTAAAKAGLTQGALELGGRGLGAAVTGTGTGLKAINASPVARSYGLTWKNIATGLGGLAGKATGMDPAMSALLARLLANPASLKAVTEGLKHGGRVPYSQVGRAADAYRNRPNQDEDFEP